MLLHALGMRAAARNTFRVFSWPERGQILSFRFPGDIYRLSLELFWSVTDENVQIVYPVNPNPSDKVEMCSGVMPQQPPMIVAPHAIHS
jgi:hypothetical protein